MRNVGEEDGGEGEEEGREFRAVSVVAETSSPLSPVARDQTYTTPLEANSIIKRLNAPGHQYIVIYLETSTRNASPYPRSNINRNKLLTYSPFRLRPSPSDHRPANNFPRTVCHLFLLFLRVSLTGAPPTGLFLSRSFFPEAC